MPARNDARSPPGRSDDPIVHPDQVGVPGVLCRVGQNVGEVASEVLPGNVFAGIVLAGKPSAQPSDEVAGIGGERAAPVPTTATVRR
jgi:hypothetical protein